MTRFGSDYEALAASPERRASLEHHRLMMEAVQLLRETMARDGISKATLADKLGKTRGFVSQIFSGTGNLTLKTLGALSSTLGFHIHLHASKDPKWNFQHDLSMSSGDRAFSPFPEIEHLIEPDPLNKWLTGYKVDFSAQPPIFRQGEPLNLTWVSGVPAGESLELFAQTKLNSSDVDTADGRLAA